MPLEEVRLFEKSRADQTLCSAIICCATHNAAQAFVSSGGASHSSFHLNQGEFTMRLVLLNICGCLLIFSSGCGGGSTEPVGPQSQVSGAVTNNGKPVGIGSLVVFFNKEKGLTLTGTLDSLGKYSLTAADPKIGIPAGRYEVAIKPPVAPVIDVSQSPDDYKKMMQGTSGADALAGSKAATAPDIPEKFNDAKTSLLVFEVKAGPNTFDLDLSKL